MKITNVNALITGGASGIGLAAAKLLLKKGAKHILLTDINTAVGQVECMKLQEEYGMDAVAFLTQDVTKVDSFTVAFEFFQERFKNSKVNFFFNNAGIGGREDALFNNVTDVASWKQVLDVDLMAVIRGVQVAVHYMKKDGGVIVNTASAAGVGPMEINPVYAAAKHGVVGFTKSLSHLAPSIRVNALCPAFTDTPMVRHGMEHSQDLTRLVMKLGGMIPVSVVAEAVLSLIQDESRAGELLMITNQFGTKYMRQILKSKL